MILKVIFHILIISTVEQMKFDTIIFDTAPTGHTLRLLNFPNLLEKGLNKIVNLKQKLGGIMNQVNFSFFKDCKSNIFQ